MQIDVPTCGGFMTFDRLRLIFETPLGSRMMKMFWTLLDQGVFAVSNFAINVLFARWLSPTDYGWFVMSFSLAMFITVLHWGTVLEPLLVQSAKVSASRARPYIASLCRAHLMLFAVVTSVALIGYSIAVNKFGSNVGLVIIGGMIGAVALNTLSAGRRLCGIFVSPQASAMIGTTYLICCVATAIMIHSFCIIGWFDVWIIIGGWSAVGSIATFGLAYRRTSGNEPYSLSEVFQFARRFFHWGLASTVCSWIRSDGLFMMLAHSAGLPAVAETRAVFNLGAPIFQANMAVHFHTIVEFSADHRSGSKRNIWRVVAFYGLGALVVSPVIWYYSDWLVNLFYNGRYVEGAWQLPLYCFLTCMQAIDSIVSSFFKANGAIVNGYATMFVTAIVSILLGVVLIPIQHTLIYVMFIATAIGMITALCLRMRAKA